MKLPPSALRGYPAGHRTIGDALVESGDVDGPMTIGLHFDNAVSTLVKRLAKEPENESVARSLAHLCQARKAYMETKGGA